MSDDQLFPWPVTERVPRETPVVELVPQPNDYRLFAFLKAPPTYHLRKGDSNEYGASTTWCGRDGRVLPVISTAVPRCAECERRRDEKVS